MVRPPISIIAGINIEGDPLPRGSHPSYLLMLVILLTGSAGPAQARAPGLADTPGKGPVAKAEADDGSLLVEYYEALIRDQDIDAFRRRVSARYTHEVLARQADSPDVQIRRVAVFALGVTGSYEDNALLARSLRDDDQAVRDMAEGALWAVWFRADTPENNQMLEEVRELIGKNHFDEAVKLSTRLIERSPKFAEAYNQRAIAEFLQAHFAESSADCRRALEYNPYHIGALGGLAQCEMQLKRRGDALKTYRRASKLQPHNESIRQAIAAIESMFD